MIGQRHFGAVRAWQRAASGSVACRVLPATAPLSATRTQVWCRVPQTPRWMCPARECHHVNGIQHGTCTACSTRRPDTSSWTCGTCGARDIPGTVKFCRRCAAAYVAPPSWTCPSCEGANPIDTANLTGSPQCVHCPYTLRPGAEAETQSSGGRAAATGGEPEGAAAPRPLPTTSIPVPTRPAPSSPHSQPPVPPRPGSSPNAAVLNAGSNTAELIGQQQGPPVDIAKLGPPGFAWMCRDKTCNHLNDGTSATCAECNGPIAPASWGCECGAVNYMLRNVCFSCNVPIRPTWLCMGCRTQTSVYEGKCRTCGEDRKLVAGRGSSSKSRRAPGASAGDWMCTACRKMNHAYRTECFGCELPRQTSDELNGSAGQPQMVGDSNWTCRSCSAVNFRTRKSCWQCNAAVARGAGAASAGIDDLDATAKPEITKEGFQERAEDDPAAPRKERRVWLANDERMEESDWVCARCMHKNFRTSKDCFKCFAPKIVAPMSRVVVKPKVKNFKL